MKSSLAFGVAIVLLVLACAGYAYPTFNGQTGNLVTPTAAVASTGQFTVAADYFDSNKIINAEKSSIPFRVLYGITPNLEIGAGYNFHKYDTQNANTYDLGVKYATPLKLAGFDFSVSALYGVTHAFDIFDDIKTTQLALIADRKIAIGDREITATLGGNWSQQDLGGSKPSAIRGFIGLSVPVIDKLTVIGEYQTKSGKLDMKQLYALGLRYGVTDAIAAQAGFTNAYPAGYVNGAAKGKFFAGLDYTFGGAAAK